jgi:hypothetical protein
VVGHSSAGSEKKTDGRKGGQVGEDRENKTVIANVYGG